ncbi:MAG TPA: DegT/DnrJ/EryC1/StrS family aminotransferase [Actinomycetota bacterium]|jgi:dTDP-4-amino-4,6-dideoxygalactose transaminase|nr:DegT/DnrJ/EryC1/StrS family aminotransferase [Actinomycetota bacterium]
MPELAMNGGTPVRATSYPSWPVCDERDVEAVTTVVKSGYWGGFPEPGPNAERFEDAFAAYQGARHGVLMANGTVTMEVALKALGIGWGDEVIVPALTFAATAYAPMASGAVPVIVDVEPRTWTIDPDQVEAAITDRTRAIMPVHLGHQMADMDRLEGIARRHGLAVVEDCAHAPGQQWRGRGAGCIGEFGSFSHQSSKILTSGEGGTLLTNDDDLARRAHSIVDCGRAKDPDEKEFTFGANYRLGELHAALLVVGMERFPEQQRERAEAGKELERLLADVPGVRVMPADERITRWSFYNYIFAIDPDSFGGRTNEVVCAALEAEGIPAEVQYPPMSRYELFQTSLSRLPVAVEHADRLDPQRMSFPVAEAAGLRESVYLMENVFRDGSRGVQDVVEALTKVQRNADELPA